MAYRFEGYPYKELVSKLKLWYENTIVAALKDAQENDLASICIDSAFDYFNHVYLRDGYHIYAYTRVLYGDPCTLAIAAIADGQNHVATPGESYPDDEEGDAFERITLPQSALDPNYVVLHDGSAEGYLEAVFACTAISRIHTNGHFDYTEVLFGKPKIPREQQSDWEIYYEPKHWEPCFSESWNTLHLIHYKSRPHNDGWELDGCGELIHAEYTFERLDNNLFGAKSKLRDILKKQRNYLLTDEFNHDLPALGYDGVKGKPCLIEVSFVRMGYAPPEEVVW